MKLLSVLLCSIAMVRFATGNNVPLHNDLYFHHHPKVARELAKSGAQKYQRRKVFFF
jgi:hypothetical protein